MEPFALKHLSGWGRFPIEECHVFRPEKRRGVGAVVASGQQANYIARGLGRSYGDASVNGDGVIDMSRLNRMLAFDAETGVLECEAGVSLAEIVATFAPRGFFLPVLPGTKFITVGGAIANDVHGKNHHQDGTFGRFVKDFVLLTARGEILRCSPRSNRDVFWATIGGVGLTGIVLTARLQLRPIETAYVLVDYLRARNIDEALAAFAESDKDYAYSVAWVDCLAKGRHLGRSVLMRGNHAPRSALGQSDAHPLRIKPKGQKTVPVDFPSATLNPLSVRLFNNFYYTLHPTAMGKLVDYDSYFFPLDSINEWNRMYGKRGFTQYQVVFPAGDTEGLIGLLEQVSTSSCASFLAVLKRLGPANPGLLSFPFEGYTLTLDIPMRKHIAAFLRELDQHVLAHGGRLYCAKDVITLPETFAAMYPTLDEFRNIKARLDPNGLFSSRLARRLAIVNE